MREGSMREPSALPARPGGAASAPSSNGSAGKRGGRVAAQAVIGLLAHVDAGKTTLAEAMLHVSGAIRAAGRVDKGASHLDTDAMERLVSAEDWPMPTYTDLLYRV